MDLISKQKECNKLNLIPEKKKSTKRRKSKKSIGSRQPSMMTEPHLNTNNNNNNNNLVNNNNSSNSGGGEEGSLLSLKKEIHSSCTTPKLEENKNQFDLNLLSPESTPIHSEDEEDEMMMMMVKTKENNTNSNNSSNNNWYSPFSTGLDLDFLPKTNQNDPLCLYKLNLSHIPSSYDHYHDSFPIISSLLQQELLQKPQSITILENHPFIPSTNHTTHSASTTNHHHNNYSYNVFGPVGDKKK
ncbi:uncharacterized protein BX663DRAFT_549159 [Cokeromyces recurvatus]|uniref:uncharacterized protein n=1 Tax=Cokeromyces recurvatus TaxID=90255 RepID=UPI00221E7706|nr:uncharacterized protein BX663DRAFT_549159 [Cokeromyces recurvatus]KAI7906039.1 hypothetical protein BX663DRAFT_549159 [Cokeromyces recurvatus]